MDYKVFDLNYYRVFYVVAKNKSFSKAANELYISQPSISYTIKELERKLNTKLFHRTSKGISLTTEGEKIFHYIEKAYANIAIGEKIIQNSKELLSGEVYIGIPTNIGNFLILDYVKKFKKKYPNIKITIVDIIDMTDRLQKLKTHKLDIIFKCGDFVNKQENQVVKKVKTVKTAFICSKNVLEQYKDISKSNLANLPLLLPIENTLLGRLLKSFFNENNVRYEPFIEIFSDSMMVEAIKRDLGVGYLIEDIVKKEIEQGMLYKIFPELELPQIDIYLSYIENDITYPAKKFLEEFILADTN